MELGCDPPVGGGGGGGRRGGLCDTDVSDERASGDAISQEEDRLVTGGAGDADVSSGDRGHGCGAVH
jgi:hypothetical protein